MLKDRIRGTILLIVSASSLYFVWNLPLGIVWTIVFAVYSFLGLLIGISMVWYDPAWSNDVPQ